MRKKPAYILLCLAAVLTFAARAEYKTFEQTVFEKAIIYCINPLSHRDSIFETAKRYAVQMPAEKAVQYNQGTARLFPIPSSGGQIIVSVPEGDEGQCRLMASKVNAIAMWDQAAYFLGEKSPFTLTDTRALDASVEKDYAASLFGDVELTLKVDNMPTPGKMQVIFDFKRINEIEKSR